MTNSNIPLSKTLIDLIEKNSESLAKDLKQYLESNNKISDFEVPEVYPLLYDSLLKVLSSKFDSFNINYIYTRDIESNVFNDVDRKHYYDCLFLDTVSKLMSFKND